MSLGSVSQEHGIVINNLIVPMGKMKNIVVSTYFVTVIEAKVCDPEEFTCRGSPGECVPLTWMCDDNPDCKDGSDEKACSKIFLATNTYNLKNVFSLKIIINVQHEHKVYIKQLDQFFV